MKFVFRATLLLVLLIFTINSTGRSQVLISLILGDELNTGNVEFGLDGGINFLNISNIPNAKTLNDWHLGFYFDIKTKQKNLFIHTGVIVKSKMGAAGIEPYPVGDSYVDSAFAGGSIERKINYFHVPVMLRWRFIDFFHLEGGIQLGLRYTAYDHFIKDVYNDEDLKFSYDIKDNFERIDAGGVAGIGYKLQKGEGVTLSVRYYYGFVDIDKITAGSQIPSSTYLCVSIPIGRGKINREKAQKETEEKK